MAITLNDIRDKEFTTQAQGYNMDEVDDFLEAVGKQFEQLLKAYKEIQDENAALKAKNAELAEPTAGDTKYFRDLEKAMRDTLINANRLAEETKIKADKEAAQTVATAKSEAEKIVSDAKAESESITAATAQMKEAARKFYTDFHTLIDTQLDLLTESEKMF